MQIALGIVGALVLVFGLSWAAMGNQFFLYKVFAPRVEQVRRETFEESKAYRQGMVQELQNMQFQYVQAAPEHQAALRSVILRRAADVPDDALTPELRAFVAQLRSAR